MTITLDELALPNRDRFRRNSRIRASDLGKLNKSNNALYSRSRNGGIGYAFAGIAEGDYFEPDLGVQYTQTNENTSSIDLDDINDCLHVPLDPTNVAIHFYSINIWLKVTLTGWSGNTHVITATSPTTGYTWQVQRSVVLNADPPWDIKWEAGVNDVDAGVTPRLIMFWAEGSVLPESEMP